MYKKEFMVSHLSIVRGVVVWSAVWELGISQMSQDGKTVTTASCGRQGLTRHGSETAM